MLFEYQASIKAPMQKVWNLIWDVQRFASLVPGCSGVSLIEDKKMYAAKVGAKVGPFKANFNMTIEVVEIEEGTYLKARASGKDLETASTLKIESLLVRLQQVSDGETDVACVTDMHLRGKLGTLGRGVVERKAEEMMKQFMAAFQRELES